MAVLVRGTRSRARLARPQATDEDYQVRKDSEVQVPCREANRVIVSWPAASTGISIHSTIRSQ